MFALFLYFIITFFIENTDFGGNYIWISEILKAKIILNDALHKNEWSG